MYEGYNWGKFACSFIGTYYCLHTSVINKSVREDEINRGLENATDYAIDVCSSYYRYIQADDNDDTYITQLMEFFCMTLNSAVKTEGE